MKGGKKYLLVLVAAMTLFLLSNPANAWGPTTHQYINDQVIKDPRLANTEIIRVINSNRAYYDSGFEVADSPVLWYYACIFGLEKGPCRYEATHSWVTQECLMRSAETDAQKAFAYGWASHLIQDSVAHNDVIPSQIMKYYTPNAIIHPITEGKIETHIIKNHPETFTRAQHALDAFLNDPVLIRKVQDCVSKTNNFDVEVASRRLADILGSPDGFYTKAFALPGVYKAIAQGNRLAGFVMILLGIGIFWLAWKLDRKILRWSIPIPLILIGLLLLVGGVSAITSISEFEQYMDKSVERNVMIFQPQNWGIRYQFDPTGFSMLKSADSKIMWLWYIIGIGFVALTGFLIYRKWSAH